MLLNVREEVNVTPLVLTDLYDRMIHLLYCFTGSHIVDRLMRETSLSCNMTHTHTISQKRTKVLEHTLTRSLTQTYAGLKC